jgi:phage antirepressor YoqD-like protein
LALALVSGYSGQMRLAMIRAIRKLEPKARIGRTISTKNYVALASITAELVDTREQLTDQIITLELQSHLDEHKVAFHDKIANSTGLYSIAELAKTLGIGKNRLLAVMRKNKILMSGGKNHNQPYQKYIDYGWLTLEFCMTENKNKNIKTKIQPKITGKGVIRITELIGK